MTYRLGKYPSQSATKSSAATASANPSSRTCLCARRSKLTAVPQNSFAKAMPTKKPSGPQMILPAAKPIQKFTSILSIIHHPKLTALPVSLGERAAASRARLRSPSNTAVGAEPRTRAPTATHPLGEAA